VSPFTLFLIQKLHYAALGFLVAAYVAKIWSIVRTRSVETDTSFKNGALSGIGYSLSVLALPWEMDAYRRHPLRYLEFALFHLAIATCIGLFVALEWARELIVSFPVVFALRAVLALGGVIGVIRLTRRFTSPEMRGISTPDDYFSVFLVSVWLFSGSLALPSTSEPRLAAFRVIGIICLFYEPFSKLFHYLYWPFLRFYLGRHWGNRGVYPVRRF
jgi:hypothetical protein